MIAKNSRTRLTYVVQIVDPVTGTLAQPAFVDLRERVQTFASDDLLPTTTAADNWATLSLDRLGDPRHYWVIADLSGVVDPFTELEPAVTVRVPSIHRLLFEILAPENFTS